MNANFPRNFRVTQEAVCKISDTFFGDNLRSFVTLLITAISEVENEDVLRNTARFYRPNFRV